MPKTPELENNNSSNYRLTKDDLNATEFEDEILYEDENDTINDVDEDFYDSSLVLNKEDMQFYKEDPSLGQQEMPKHSIYRQMNPHSPKEERPKPKWYKNKKIMIPLISGIVVLVIIIISLICFFAFRKPQQIFPKKVKPIEYGEVVSLDPANLVNKKKTDKDIIDKIEIGGELVENRTEFDFDYSTYEVVSRDEEYLDAGTYEIVLRYDGEEQTTELTVKDSVDPEFIGVQPTITVEQDAENFDVTTYFFAQDLAPVKLSSKGEVNISTPGTYNVKVTATDKNKNKTSIDCTVNVVTQQEVQNGTALTPTVDGSVPVSEDTMKKVLNGVFSVNIAPMNADLQAAIDKVLHTSYGMKNTYGDTTNITASYLDEDILTRGKEKAEEIANQKVKVESMESLGFMSAESYRNYIYQKYSDENGGLLGTYQPESNTFTGTFEDTGKKFAYSASGLGIFDDEEEEEEDEYSSSSKNSNSSSNSSGSKLEFGPTYKNQN